jgi:hypothetical protein
VLRHRWSVGWDYFAGVLHIDARCGRCGRHESEAVDLLSSGMTPGEGNELVYESRYGRVGPITWEDEETWTNVDEPAVLYGGIW